MNTFIVLFVSLIIFLLIAALIILLGGYYNQSRSGVRLHELIGGTRSRSKLPRVGAASLTKINSVVESLSKLSLPEEGWQNSELKLKFVRAGLVNLSDQKIFYAVKTLLSVIVPILSFIILWQFFSSFGFINIFFYVVLIAAIGYYLPDLYLRKKIKKRVMEMQEALPDVIDLLVICTESGLGLDAAINRVASDVASNSAVLSKEFYLTSLEIRAGAGRTSALKNMALRTNLEDLQSFVSMLVQADKFGTSLADSLRIQSEMMRIKRIQRAEEVAAKVPVKMLLPLILFIFPALMIVLIAPAAIHIGRTLGQQ